MKETYKEINLGFSLHDCKILNLEMPEWHVLRLKIANDSDKQIISLKFVGVLAFSFGYCLQSEFKYDNDKMFLVDNSEWRDSQIRVFRSNYLEDSVESLVHYKLCFNSDNEELNIVCEKQIILESN